MAAEYVGMHAHVRVAMCVRACACVFVTAVWLSSIYTHAAITITRAPQRHGVAQREGSRRIVLTS